MNPLWINQVSQDMPLFSVRSAGSLQHIIYALFVLFWQGFSKLSVYFLLTNLLGHSFRRGGATFVLEAKVPSELIKAEGDWRSDCYLN